MTQDPKVQALLTAFDAFKENPSHKLYNAIACARAAFKPEEEFERGTVPTWEQMKIFDPTGFMRDKWHIHPEVLDYLDSLTRRPVKKGREFWLSVTDGPLGPSWEAYTSPQKHRDNVHVREVIK